VLLLALLIALLLVFLAWPVGLVLAVVVAAAGVFLWRLLARWRQVGAGVSSLGEAGQTPQAVDDLPNSPDFVISAPGTGLQATVGASDSPDAVRFKTALRDLFTLVQASKAAAPEQPPIRLDLKTVATTTIGAIDPIVTIPRRAISAIFIPPWILAQIGERFGEVMAYPKIDLPMYEPLKAISAELFLPNIKLIKPNSITLIETNQRFIEAYMVGLNHEFARKLLWREYPTYQRGSYFRQFWDVRSYFNADNLDDAALKEKLYDIPELHRWSLDSALGRQNNRSTAAGEDAVLVIRGELLKKYPTAVIYAHRAKWERKPDNSIDLTQPRTLEDIDAAFEDKPPTIIVRTPLYEAKVDPDIYFFGFDLTIPQAKGGPGTNPNDDPGWFFVIKERPGEPRFGLELERKGALEILAEVTWKDTGARGFLPAGSLAPIALTAPPAGPTSSIAPRSWWRSTPPRCSRAGRNPMADSARSELTAARRAHDAKADEARRATQELRALEAERARFLRDAPSGDRATAAKAAELKQAIEAAATAVKAAKGALGEAIKTTAQAAAAFAEFSDPRQNVGRLSDRSPFVLMPIRIETRFATSTVRDVSRRELLVRIFPDDCWVDSFESDLSTTELANAKRYWQAMWRSGGFEADQRAAWRDLVAAHGSGRAARIADHYQPTNVGNPPAKPNATDVILVIPATAALADAEAQAIATYWQTVWLADGNAALVANAQNALATAVGAARAAELAAGYVPYNFADRPASPLRRRDVALTTAFVLFPSDPPTKQQPWSQAPRINRLADRFVVLGFRGGVKVIEAIGGAVTLPLYVGPDPSSDPDETIHPDGADLFVPPELRWLADFDEAVKAGVGLRIGLSVDDARLGFDRLLVLGLELGMSDVEGKAALEELLAHHRDGRSGLALVPQGTPTHNTTGKGTGYTRFEDPDVSFADRRDAPLFAVTDDPLKKRDGQWLAEALGIDPALFVRVHAANGADQLQARAMHRALWSATIGYWMDKLMPEVFSDAAVDDTRWFFTSYVHGRGAVPAIRVGGQPYGILPTTAFSRIAWLDRRHRLQAAFGERGEFLARLLTLLREVGADWAALRSKVAHVGATGDAHQILLDIVGLHPASVEFHARYAETIDQLFNTVNLLGFGADFWRRLIADALDGPARALLARFGHQGPDPQILKQYFFKDAQKVGSVIDDRPLSESDRIRAYTADNRNYIAWLIDAAKSSLTALYQERGFADDRTPDTLLYLFLRHALMLGYHDTSYRLYRTADVLGAAALQAMRPEPSFIHVAAAAQSESRFAHLYKTEAAITGSPTLLVSDFITANLAVRPESRQLAEQIDALSALVDAPTAALERLFVEHIDCCAYRYDSWLLGLVDLQLETMRKSADGQAARTGLYLGAYGWLEDLRPRAPLVPAELPDDIKALFPGPPIMRDANNGGYIHAPSLVHAHTAAVMRSGYLANATPANPDTLSVNLSSARVRVALSLLEGIRNGQSLGALLGYQFERGLHDDHGLVEVDKFIYPLRKAFPLAADAIAATRTPPDTPIKAIEARNVMDGLKLIEHVRSHGGNYPFGLATLPAASVAEAAAIGAQVARMLDAYDAVADLALAEGVHQAVQGNFDRVGATLDTYSTGNFPPQPEVVQTPTRGISLTHRVALHLRSGVAPPPGATPRAIAQPAVDDWLATLLPPLADIVCTVNWADPASGAGLQRVVSLADLALRPIDLLELVKPDSVQTMDELDERVLRFVTAAQAPRPDANLAIAYIEAPAGKLSVFQATALLRRLKTLLAKARALRATDAILHNEAAPADDDKVTLDRARVASPKALLDGLATDMSGVIAARQPALDDTVANRDAIVAAIDATIDEAVELLQRAALLAVPLAGWGFLYTARRKASADLYARIGKLVKRWSDRLDDFTTRLLAYDNLPVATTADARFAELRRIEMLVTTRPDPLPPAPADLRNTLDGKGGVFAARRDAFKAILDGNAPSLAATIAAAKATATADLDPQGLDLAPVEDQVIALAQEIQKKLAAVANEIERRSIAIKGKLDEHDASASPAARVAALVAGGQALFGTDIRLLPEFALSAAQAGKWANALAYSGGGLTDHLRNDLGVDDPVGEWLAGAARVRPNLRNFEQMSLIAGAFGKPEPALIAAQFPYEADAPWLALEYPDTYKLESDHLLYTACYAEAFDGSKPQTGLLVDEWTEVIPAADRDTGITLHNDRPDSEPPQSILLVMPASASGEWQWDDLVGALNETLDLAKTRGVEPVHVDATAYARFLPATVLAVTLFGFSISTALATANGVYRTMKVPEHV
jgi:hypothetical protein